MSLTQFLPTRFEPMNFKDLSPKLYSCGIYVEWLILIKYKDTIFLNYFKGKLHGLNKLA